MNLEKSFAPQDSIPPYHKFFQINRMGLPLSWADNFKCALVILLTVALQIRLENSLLAEGWIIFFGLVCYVAMRYWLLRLRYPETGEIELKDDLIVFPACLSNNETVSFSHEKMSAVEIYCFRGKSGIVLSSIQFRQGQRLVKINWLGTEIGPIEQELQKLGVKTTRIFWQPGVYVAIFLLIFATAMFLAAYLIRG